MKTIKRAELTNLRMVAGNESKVSTAVIDGHVKTWAGIGWVTERRATDQDRQVLPVVED